LEDWAAPLKLRVQETLYVMLAYPKSEKDALSKSATRAMRFEKLAVKLAVVFCEKI